jgi:putative ABC transport system ATP-binding protein/lipoprotein-releasing system ATP-binding protein
MGIKAESITKSFGRPPTHVLNGIDLDIKDGEFISLTGKSGSGKSTLLYILSSLDSPTSGRILLDNQDITLLSEKEIHFFRNTKMGFIFQFHYLLPELTALQNILMPSRKTNQEEKLKEKAIYLMDDFGLKGQYHKKPSQLSGGEQQRVSIARALIMEPNYLFADEPTGNLDSTNGIIVMDIFAKINKNLNTTIIYVTHDEDYAKLASRRIHLVDGVVVE